MVHSDAHPFNMMFVKNADGEASDELRAILDWQVSKLPKNPQISFRASTPATRHSIFSVSSARRRTRPCASSTFPGCLTGFLSSNLHKCCLNIKMVRSSWGESRRWTCDEVHETGLVEVDRDYVLLSTGNCNSVFTASGPDERWSNQGLKIFKCSK